MAGWFGEMKDGLKNNNGGLMGRDWWTDGWIRGLSNGLVN